MEEARARVRVVKWLNRYNLEDVTYEEHRLLARLITRFPVLNECPAAVPRLAGIQRQMRARGRLNMHTALPFLSSLSAHRVPWVLTGAAQWFVRSGFPFCEGADSIECSIPESARALVEPLLAEEGWRPEWVPRGPGAVLGTFSKGDVGRIRLCNADKLFRQCANRHPMDVQLWEEKIQIDYSSVSVFVPHPLALFSMAVNRSQTGFIPRDQWVFDLFNLTVLAPDVLEFSSCARSRQCSRKIERFFLWAAG
jgi:hypothetical protein